jgi:O-antigen/teichoic acid export membrane protein
MIEKIKGLGTDTAIYGISTIVGRFLNFLLVPFYTNVLYPSEYGIVAYVFSLVAVMNVVYGYGMESAYFRYAATQEIGTTEENFNTPFLSLFLTSALFSAIMLVAAPTTAGLIGIPERYAPIVEYATWILFFDTLAVVPFATLRLERRTKYFASVKILNIVTNVGANLIFLLVFRMGVEGIFLANLVASTATLMFLYPTIKQKLTTSFSPDLYKALLRFGLPYIPAGLAAMMIQVIDRPILRMLTDDATVGVYQANYRLGIFMMLVVQMFDYAWRPFFLSHAKDPDAKPMYARVLTYFVLFMSSTFLLLTFFIPDIVGIRIFGRHIIHQDYWGALGIVPIILLGYMFLGVYNNLIAGIYIEKKTYHLPTVTFIGAGVNVLANFILIPAFGAYGAAWATLLSYASMALALYIIVQRIYPIVYERTRLAKIAVSTAVVLGMYYLIPFGEFMFAGKIFLLLVFCGAMLSMRFFTGDELGSLRSLFRQPDSSAQVPPDSNGLI